MYDLGNVAKRLVHHLEAAAAMTLVETAPFYRIASESPAIYILQSLGTRRALPSKESFLQSPAEAQP